MKGAEPKTTAVELAPPATRPDAGLPVWAIGAWGMVAFLFMHIAYSWPGAGYLALLYLFSLLQMARAKTWRQAFYPGLGVGLILAVFRLDFFWRIFSAGAFALWFVFALWIALFVALARIGLRWQDLQTPFFDFRWVLVPLLWCGLEYFRSELYYLRFAWLTPGFAFAERPGWVPFSEAGSYGVGFLLMGIACAAAGFWRTSKLLSLSILFFGGAAVRLAGPGSAVEEAPAAARIRVAGVQMEFPTEKEVLLRLSDLVRKCPEAELIVLSEYTFGERVPEKVRSWCREHQRYLVVGGKEPRENDKFYNTVFVVSTNGEVAFRQVKSVPIQFFKDGLPAPEQNVWNSPWGRIGICVCYDLSYSRVTDRLVKLGAEALLVPTMDVADWGERQHRLHARVAPVRAAEYGIPIFRLASSGISQFVDARGRVRASAPCPGDGAMISASLELRGPGHLPADRWLGPGAAVFTVLMIIAAAFNGLRRKPPHMA